MTCTSATQTAAVMRSTASASRSNQGNWWPLLALWAAAKPLWPAPWAAWLKCQQGSSIDGQDITALSLNDLRSKISLVPQEGYLFTATLADNLRFGRPEASDAEMRQAARQAQLEGDVQAFPNGYDTLVGERGITLSGGQRQRTALARALLVDAPILVLDDALASVDNRTAAAILQSLTLNQQRSVLFISHQLSAAAACDRVLVLDGGRVVQQGTSPRAGATERHLPPAVGRNSARSWKRPKTAEI